MKAENTSEVSSVPEPRQELVKTSRHGAGISEPVSPLTVIKPEETIPTPHRPSVHIFAEKLGSTLAERHPTWKPIKLKLYFSGHDTAEDLAGIKEPLQDADIYFYENIAGNGNTEFLQQVANADLDTLPPNYIDQLIQDTVVGGAPIEGTRNEAIIRSLYGSKKIVGHIDLRPGDLITGNDIMAVLTAETPIDEDFDTSLDHLKAEYKENIRLQNERENIMTARFEEEMERIIAAHPELKDKPDIHILATVGSNHTSLYHKFKAQGVDTEREFSVSPYLYDFRAQAQRDISFGKEPNKDVLAKAYLEKIIAGALSLTLPAPIANYDQEVKYIRSISSQFTTQEIESVHKLYVEGLDVEVFDEVLRAKGLDSIPTNEDQVTNYLSKQDEKKTTTNPDI